MNSLSPTLLALCLAPLASLSLATLPSVVSAVESETVEERPLNPLPTLPPVLRDGPAIPIPRAERPQRQSSRPRTQPNTRR